MPASFPAATWMVRSRRSVSIALAIGFSSAAIGCDAGILAPELVGDEWRLVFLVAPDTTADESGNPDAPTVRFGTETRNPRQLGFRGTLACNRFSGHLEMHPGGFMRVVMLETTLAFCFGPDTRVEARFVDAFATAVRFDRRGAALYITSRDGTRLEFQAP